MLGLGLGIACVFIPAQAFSMATITKTQTGRASSIFNAGKQLGGAVGVALLTTVLAAAGPTRQTAGHVTANLAAYRDAFLAAAATALLAVCVALTFRDTDAAATMVPRQRRHQGKQDEEPAAGPGSRDHLQHGGPAGTGPRSPAGGKGAENNVRSNIDHYQH
jgi:hypothetical protein